MNFQCFSFSDWGIPRNYSSLFDEPRLTNDPWSTTIRQFGYKRCNGVIISNLHILTTETCILPYNGSPVERSPDDLLPENFW